MTTPDDGGTGEDSTAIELVLMFAIACLFALGTSALAAYCLCRRGSRGPPGWRDGQRMELSMPPLVVPEADVHTMDWPPRPPCIPPRSVPPILRLSRCALVGQPDGSSSLAVPAPVPRYISVDERT